MWALRRRQQSTEHEFMSSLQSYRFDVWKNLAGLQFLCIKNMYGKWCSASNRTVEFTQRFFPCTQRLLKLGERYNVLMSSYRV